MSEESVVSENTNCSGTSINSHARKDDRRQTSPSVRVIARSPIRPKHSVLLCSLSACPHLFARSVFHSLNRSFVCSLLRFFVHSSIRSSVRQSFSYIAFCKTQESQKLRRDYRLIYIKCTGNAPKMRFQLLS